MDQKELRYKLITISRDMHRYAHDVIAPICAQHNITVQQLYVLMELRVQPNQKVSELSDRVGILHTNFPLVCRKLEQLNYVRRSRSEVDKRSFILSLTSSGEQLIEKMDREISDDLSVMLGAGTKETYECIVKGFESIEALLENASINHQGEVSHVR